MLKLFLAVCSFALTGIEACHACPSHELAVAVIGSGMAGATSAWLIHNHTGASVTVYEAEDIVGGRLKETEIDGKLVELGGSIGIAANRYFVETTDLLHLERVTQNSTSFGIFDGDRFVVSSDTSLIQKAWRCGGRSPAPDCRVQARKCRPATRLCCHHGAHRTRGRAGYVQASSSHNAHHPALLSGALFGMMHGLTRFASALLPAFGFGACASDPGVWLRPTAHGMHADTACRPSSRTG
jgi:hypothetical protein